MLVRLICPAIALMLAPWPSAAAQEPAPKAKVDLLACDPLPELPGKSVATVTVAFPVGARSSAHRHPGSLSVYVLKGKIRSQLDSGPARIYSVGESWFEPAGAVHAVAENVSSTQPAELLAVMVVGEGCKALSAPVAAGK